MRLRFLLLAAFSGFSLLAARAQRWPGESRSVRLPPIALVMPYPARPPGPRALPLATAPVPTVRSAAAYAPLHPVSLPAAHPPLAAEALLPRHDLTGAPAAPPYDLYQGQPAEFRKRTLPAVWAEPLPLHVLRGALSR